MVYHVIRLKFKNMIEKLLSYLKDINNNYSQLFILIIALITFIILYREYIAKRRPYIFPELIFENKDDNWFFSFILKNSGVYPAIVKVNKAKLIIGDELYPTEFNSEMLISPGEVNKILPIGYINTTGRNNINNSHYNINIVQIEFEVVSKTVGDKKYKYTTEIIYKIDVKNELPAIHLVFEKFI